MKKVPEGGAGEIFHLRGGLGPEGGGLNFSGGAGSFEEISSKLVPIFQNFPLRGAETKLDKNMVIYKGYYIKTTKYIFGIFGTFLE